MPAKLLYIYTKYCYYQDNNSLGFFLNWKTILIISLKAHPLFVHLLSLTLCGVCVCVKQRESDRIIAVGEKEIFLKAVLEFPVSEFTMAYSI